MTSRLLATLAVVPAIVLTQAGRPEGRQPGRPEGRPLPIQAAAQRPTPPTPTPQAPRTPTPPAPGTSQDVYQIGRDRIVPPRLLKEVRPSYTAEAVRNRIQGKVRVRAIVERDGTVSGVEVVESLDKQFGLDEAAVNAVKQWQFQPGTLDGNPVRVMITVEVSLALRDTTPVQGWPPGFANAVPAPDSIAETVEAPGLRLKVRRPVNWLIRRDGPPNEWVSLRTADGLESMLVLQPQPVQVELRWPASDADVQSLPVLIQRMQPTANLETTAVGQMRTPTEASWIWSSFRVPSLPNPPGVTDAAKLGEGRMWTFATTVNGKMVLVVCIVMFPFGADPATIESTTQKAASHLSPIVGSLQLEAAN